MEQVTIIPFLPEYQSDFKQINVDWISDMFTVEPHDLEQLDHPEIHILPDGGEVLLAQYGGAIVGTVAMIRTGPDEFELAKMGMKKEARGLGIGRLLCEAAVDYARKMEAKRVWLESNKKAEVAVKLYESIGFVHIPLRDSLYARANVHMELLLG
ncbi:MAG: GNAT family N-acetyltransferase [Cytophagaceae bacterium]|nr:MAG: GNAT family N-acetyltransferase [Cytophagaceae bacterium]